MLIVLNHKMNLTVDDALEYQRQLAQKTYQDTVVVCPSYPYLPLFKGPNYQLGSQDVSAFAESKHTGEVSAYQLQSLKVSYCLVGHSERRTFAHEDNACIQAKLEQLLEHDMIPILCIGETKQDHLEHKTWAVLERDLKAVMEPLSLENRKKVVIAYEPLFSIGTGEVLENDQIAEVLTCTKRFMKETYGIDSMVLYGGSVNDKNFHHLKEIEVLDGFLIGGFSLQITELQKLL